MDMNDHDVAIALGLMENALPRLDHGATSAAASLLRQAINAVRKVAPDAKLEPDSAALIAGIVLP